MALPARVEAVCGPRKRRDATELNDVRNLQSHVHEAAAIPS